MLPWTRYPLRPVARHARGLRRAASLAVLAGGALFAFTVVFPDLPDTGQASWRNVGHSGTTRWSVSPVQVTGKQPLP